MLTPRIGLLPFYFALYVKVMPELRKRLEPFVQTITDDLPTLPSANHSAGLDVFREELLG